MFARSITRLTLALIIVIASLLLVTSFTVTAAAPTTDARPLADLIVNPGESIQAAIDAANDGDTIIVNAGNYTESLTLSKPVSLTGVNSDTTILHAVAGQRVLTVTGATITNSVVISGLTFTGGSATDGGGVYLDAPLMVLNARFISNTASMNGGGLYASKTVTLTNVEFSSNTAQRGGALYASAGADIADSRIEDNRATGGGGIFSAGSLDFKRTTVISNSSGWGGGGGVLVDRDADLTLSDVAVISNTTARSDGGGGIQVNSGAVLVTNSRFEGNQCHCSGGGLNMTGGSTKSLIISQTVFINNDAATGGGLFSVFAPTTIVDTQFISNTAHMYNGGGFHSNQGSVMLIGGQFVSNTAQHGGGGLFAYPYFDTAEVHISGTQFLHNRAIDTGTSHGLGGGAAIMGASVITNGLFEGNVAHGQQGGGLMANYLIATNTTFISNTVDSSFGWGGGASAGVATIADSQFEGNTAGGFGGGLASQWATVTGVRFISNTASNSGGGFYQYGDGRSSIVNTLFARNTAASAGGSAIATVSAGSLDVLHATIATAVANSQSAIAAFGGTLGVMNTLITNHAIGISNTGGTVTEDYNLFYGNITNTVGVTMGAHSLVGDPKFIDPNSGNYALRFGSAAIDSGIDAGISFDIEGNSRPQGRGFDIGAYEYQGMIYRAFLPIIKR